jgi:pyruvate dehydrogenase E1 component
VESDIWSATSFTELAREGRDCDRHNMLNPGAKPREAYVAQCLKDAEGPVVAATDNVKAYADQIRTWVPGRYVVLGTDGFGRSDLRSALRRHFEVDSHFVAVAALKALADEGAIPAAKVGEAIKKYGIDVNRPNPLRA